MHVELQGAYRVGDVLYRVALAMGIVVHRVDTPFVSGTVMRSMDDTVHQGIAEHHVRMGHVDLGSEHLGAIGELPVLHPLEQIQVLLHAAVPPGAVHTGLLDGAPVLTYLLLSLVVHVCQSFLDEHHCPVIELLEIVGGVVLPCPVETQPPDVLLDGVHVLGVLLHWVGVVEAEIGLAAILLCQAEIEADALGMADMQITVRLRREPGHHRLYPAARQVILDNLFQEIFLHGPFRRGLLSVRIFHWTYIFTKSQI